MKRSRSYRAGLVSCAEEKNGIRMNKARASIRMATSNERDVVQSAVYLTLEGKRWKARGADRACPERSRRECPRRQLPSCARLDGAEPRPHTSHFFHTSYFLIDDW